MLRYLLLIVVTALLAGCHCSVWGCALDEDLDWVGSYQAAGELWESEQDRIRQRPTDEATPDTTEVADSLSVQLASDETETVLWFFVKVPGRPSACSVNHYGTPEGMHLLPAPCP